MVHYRSSHSRYGDQQLMLSVNCRHDAFIDVRTHLTCIRYCGDCFFCRTEQISFGAARFLVYGILTGFLLCFLIQYAVYLPEASVHILHADDIAGIDRSVCSFELRK